MPYIPYSCGFPAASMNGGLLGQRRHSTISPDFGNHPHLCFPDALMNALGDQKAKLLLGVPKIMNN